MHLLWDCDFAQDSWKSLIPNKKRDTSVYEDTMLAMDQLPKSFSMEIVTLDCWNIWIQRNGRVFRDVQPTIQAWRYFFKADLKLLQFKIKEKHA